MVATALLGFAADGALLVRTSVSVAAAFDGGTLPLEPPEAPTDGTTCAGDARFVLDVVSTWEAAAGLEAVIIPALESGDPTPLDSPSPWRCCRGC